MANIKVDLYSKMLNQTVSVELYLPYDENEDKEADGVIYLLHGMLGSSNSWTTLTPASRYAKDNNLILIAPQAHNSFYADDLFGEKYFSYMTLELPKLLKTMFNIPTQREKTFVAGLSMGGYGAMLLGLSRPDLYAACATFSGAVQFGRGEVDEKSEFATRYLAPIFGNDFKKREELDLYPLAKKVSTLNPQDKPRVLCTCGLQDYLYEGNVQFKDYMKTLDLDFTYMEWPGFHEWNFWDRSIVYAIDFFLNNGYAKKCHDFWRTEPSN